jgi:hypothetical protein
MIPPIKNRPKTDGSEKTTRGNATEKIFSGRKRKYDKYIIVITT